MSILHGSWILQPTNSYFFLWSETWRNLDKELLESLANSKSASLHPFNLTQPEFQALVGSHSLLQNCDREPWQTEIITLPSQPIAKKKSLVPVLSEQFNEKVSQSKSLSFQAWQVEGVRLKASQTIQFLRKLPLGSLPSSELSLGGDLRFWTHIYRWSLDLLARGKYLPGIVRQQGDRYKSQWYPLLDSNSDRSRFAKFSSINAFCFI
ncbi:MAG: hypothetical protein HC820_09070 [Hydrococcus sp. RM1_1_31]|nr:hypothetical protein [Hydrococcus sp. RM1_1_31]